MLQLQMLIPPLWAAVSIAALALVSARVSRDPECGDSVRRKGGGWRGPTKVIRLSLSRVTACRWVLSLAAVLPHRGHALDPCSELCRAQAVPSLPHLASFNEFL